MKLKYFIFLSAVISSAYYLYQNEAIFETLMGKVHQIAPGLNQSTLYKWKNSKGEWQITDTPPNQGIVFTTITSQDQVNVMPSPSSKKKK